MLGAEASSPGFYAAVNSMDPAPRGSSSSSPLHHPLCIFNGHSPLRPVSLSLPMLPWRLQIGTVL